MNFQFRTLVALSFILAESRGLHAASTTISKVHLAADCNLQPEALPTTSTLLQNSLVTDEERNWGITSVVYGCVSIPFDEVWEFFRRNSGLDKILTGYSLSIPAVVGTQALGDIPWPQTGAVRLTLFDRRDLRTIVTGLWAEERVDQFSKDDGRFLYRVYAFDSPHFERILDHICAQFQFMPLPGGKTLVTWSYTLVPLENKTFNRKLLTTFTRYQLHPYMIESLSRIIEMIEVNPV